MSTRQRKSPPNPTQEHSQKDLPPPRQRKALRPVSKPLSNTRLTSLIYYIAGIALLIGAFYAWRITQWKAEAGGWWNLALGKRPPQMQAQGGGGAKGRPGAFGGGRGSRSGGGGGRAGGKGDVEDRINDLAEILGLKPTDLASAISGAVKEHVAPATLSSISSSASAAGAAKTAVDALVGEEAQDEGIAAGMANTMGSIVGLDEPVDLD